MFLYAVFAEQVEVPKKKGSKSLYAKATDTGVDPREAAKRLKMDWDTAAEIEDPDVNDETEVPPAVVCFLCSLKEFQAFIHLQEVSNQCPCDKWLYAAKFLTISEL